MLVNFHFLSLAIFFQEEATIIPFPVFWLTGNGINSFYVSFRTIEICLSTSIFLSGQVQRDVRDKMG